MSAWDQLRRLLGPLDALVVDEPSGLSGRPMWIQAPEWRIFARARPVPPRGAEIERFLIRDGPALSARWDSVTGKLLLPFSPSEAYFNLISEGWRSDGFGGLSARQLDFYYSVKRFMPRSWQLAARRLLIRLRGLPDFPAWPFEPSGDHLLRFYARCCMLVSGTQEMAFRWFWPGGRRAALILTHDVESAEGLRLAVDLADLEEERGFRSSFNVVADWYPVDDGIIRELSGRGFELGVHGVYHDRSMFSSRAMFDAQQPLVRKAAARFGAVGFRSPATHRVFEWLGDLPVDYDCSIPHSDPFEPQPGGCCTLWPFFVGDLVELPYTMPQDHTLFTLLGHRTIDLWLDQVDRLVSANGLIQSVTHPDPGYLGEPKERALYREFLDAVSERDDIWKSLPRELASWWRQRDRGEEGPEPLHLGLARLEGDTAVLVPV